MSQTQSIGESLPSAAKVPRPASHRFEALDALRGLAVLGIFAINIIGFALPEIAFSNPKVAGGAGALNYGLWSFTTVFIEGSMRGLFSMMFGAGVILFTTKKLMPQGTSMVWPFYRRTSWLIVFGLAHAFLLLMPGDILLIYGIAGLVLYPLRRVSPARLTMLSAVLIAGLTLLTLEVELQERDLALEAQAIERALAAGEVITEEERELLADWEYLYEGNWPPAEELREQIAARTGAPATVFQSNAEIVALYSTFEDLLWWVADALAMMALGMAFYKWRIITAERSLRFYLLLAAIGYGVGLSFRIWAVDGRWDADFSPILWAWGTFDQIGRLAVTVGHIGMFFVLWKFFQSSLPMRALKAAGRMALTNYIGQTVVANLIFTGVGLGLYGALERTSIYGLVVLIWLAQLALSMWWLSRFRMGPLEWGWRYLTYGKIPPLRK